MLNLKLLSYAIFIIILSLFVILTKPEMHKQVEVTNSEYEYINKELPNTNISTSSTNINNTPYQIKNNNLPQKAEKRTQKITKPQTVSEQYKQSKRDSIKQTSPQQQSPAVKTTINKPAEPVTKKQTQEIKQEKEPQTQPATKPTLTEREEIIAWNKWRSNLQNQVMKDSNVRAPLGTQFKFSFTVDKYGNMSNVKVWSTTPSYTDYAVRTIKPVLMSYRNKAILNFPEGTKRVITNVEGGFVISRVTEYSTPADYHDYERVKR